MIWIFISVFLLLLVLSPGFRVVALVVGGLALVVALALGGWLYVDIGRDDSRRAAQEEIRRSGEQQAAKLHALFEAASHSVIGTEDLSFQEMRLYYKKPYYGERVYLDDPPPPSRDVFGHISESSHPVVFGNDALHMVGRLKNLSARFNLLRLTMDVSIRDCGYNAIVGSVCEIVGECRVPIETFIPVGQARDFDVPLRFGNQIERKTTFQLEYKVSDTEGVISVEAMEADANELTANSGPAKK